MDPDPDPDPHQNVMDPQHWLVRYPEESHTVHRYPTLLLLFKINSRKLKRVWIFVSSSPHRK